VDRTGFTTTSNIYQGEAGPERRSGNALDGNMTTYWGSWQCMEWPGLCWLGVGFPEPMRLSRIVIHHQSNGLPEGLDVSFGEDVVYSGPASTVMTVTRNDPPGVQGILLHETALPNPSNWWVVFEIDFWRCP
jgi:hypothetical protein